MLQLQTSGELVLAAYQQQRQQIYFLHKKVRFERQFESAHTFGADALNRGLICRVSGAPGLQRKLQCVMVFPGQILEARMSFHLCISRVGVNGASP